MDYTASIICMDPLNIKVSIKSLLEKGWEGKLHADFMDGHFVPRLGLYPEIIKEIKKYFGDNISIDSHLMLEHPLDWIDDIAPYSDIVFYHREIKDDIARIQTEINKKYPNVKQGIAINPFTNIGKDYLFQYFDYFLLMGISPGVLGSKTYKDIVIKKAYKLGFNLDKNPIIYVDGAVTFDNIADYKLPKINCCVVGSSTLYNYSDGKTLDYNIKKLKELS